MTDAMTTNLGILFILLAFAIGGVFGWTSRRHAINDLKAQNKRPEETVESLSVQLNEADDNFWNLAESTAPQHKE